MRIPLNQDDAPPLPRKLLDRISVIAQLAIITLLWLLPSAWLLWVLAVAFVVLLAQARRRCDATELERAKQDERTAIARAAQSLRPPEAAPPQQVDQSDE